MSGIAFSTLVSGLIINLRFNKILKRKVLGGGATAIDKVYFVNNCLFILGFGPLLVYFIANYNLFPMSDYVGEIGCVYFALLLDQFIRIYSHVLPITVVMVRYLFVLHSNLVKVKGTESVVNALILISIITPAFLITITRFPTFDFIHGPYNHCLGRFEVYFNPKHPDPITQGEYFLDSKIILHSLICLGIFHDAFIFS